MLSLCFYFPEDDIVVGFWDHIIRAYGIKNVYVICEHDDVGPWHSISSFDELPKDHLKVFFSPKDALYSPGLKSIHNLVPPEDVILCFGSDDKHNHFDSEDIYYIPTPNRTPMYAVQAGHIAIENWMRHHGNK